VAGVCVEKERHLIHRHVRTCRPLGEDAFVENLQQVLGRSLRPQKPEPKWRWMRVKYTVPGIHAVSWGAQRGSGRTSFPKLTNLKIPK
jgi:hypothetical protein